MNRHERRKAEAVARYKYGTRHGSPKTPAVEEGKAKKRKRLLTTKQEKKLLEGAR